jgi:hypothetical protein
MLKKFVFPILLLLAGSTLSAIAQVKIGDNATTLTPSAVLEANSTTKGFLLPRMSQAQMNAIASPEPGLMVYCLDCSPTGLRIYNGLSWGSFNVEYPNPATFTCGSVTTTQSPSGTFLSNTSYSGTYTLSYTAGNGQNYYPTTITQDGLSLTRIAGNYAASGGNVVYSLSGTYTGTTGTVIFRVPEGCSAAFGDSVRLALVSAGCASCSAYDAAAANDWIQVTAAEYAALADTLKISGASKAGINDAGLTLNGVGPAGWNGSTPMTTAANNAGSPYDHALIPASSYIIAYTAKYAYNTGALSVGGQQVKWGTSVSSGFTTYGGSFPSVYLYTANTQLYFINKRPATTTNTSPSYLGTYTTGPMSYCQSIGTTIYWTNGNVTTLSTNNNGLNKSLQHQVIVTGNKSW